MRYYSNYFEIGDEEMVLGRGEGAPEEAPAGAAAVLPLEGAPPGAGVAPLGLLLDLSTQG